MKCKIKIISAIFVFLTFGFIPHSFAAQNTIKGLSITPYSFDVTLNPGQTITQTIDLSNLTDSDVDITVAKKNFSANGEEGEIVLSDNENSFSLSPWMTIVPDHITIPKYKKQTFNIQIAVPKNAEPGGHFGSVVFSTIPQKNINGSGAALSQEIAALELVKIAGNSNENAKVVSFAPEKSFYQQGPVIFDIRVKNFGNVHIKPAGSVSIINMFGQKTVIPVEEKNVLPGAIRKIQATLPQTFLIGPYKATLSLSYGTQNNALLVANGSFFAFPVKLGIGILIAIIIIIILRKRLKKAIITLITGK